MIAIVFLVPWGSSLVEGKEGVASQACVLEGTLCVGFDQRNRTCVVGLVAVA